MPRFKVFGAYRTNGQDCAQVFTADDEDSAIARALEVMIVEKVVRLPDPLSPRSRPTPTVTAASLADPGGPLYSPPQTATLATPTSISSFMHPRDPTTWRPLTPKTLAAWVMLVAGVVVGVIWIGLATRSSPQTAPVQSSTAIPPQLVLHDESFEDGALRVLLRQIWYQAGPMSRSEVEKAIQLIHRAGRERCGPRTDRLVTRHIAFLYNSKENAVSGGGNWLGRVHWRDDTGQPEFEYHDSIIAASTRPPTVIGGRAEGLRREIYRAMVEADRRATRESRQNVDMSNVAEAERSVERWRSLRDEYVAAVHARYGLSREEANAIHYEAYESGWDNGGQ